MDNFLTENAWGIVVGLLGLVVNGTIIFATVKASIRSLEVTTATHSNRLNVHSERLSELERHQAERLGYERARQEFQQYGGPKP